VKIYIFVKINIFMKKYIFVKIYIREKCIFVKINRNNSIEQGGMSQV